MADLLELSSVAPDSSFLFTELGTFACGSKAAVVITRTRSGPKVSASRGELEMMIYRSPVEVFAQKVERLEIGRQETPAGSGLDFLDVKEAMAAMVAMASCRRKAY